MRACRSTNIAVISLNGLLLAALARQERQLGVDSGEVGVDFCQLGVAPLPNGHIARAMAEYDAWAEQEYEAIEIMPESTHTHNSTTIHNSIHNPILSRSKSSPQGQGLAPGLGQGSGYSGGGEANTVLAGATEGIDRLASSQSAVGDVNAATDGDDDDDNEAAVRIREIPLGINIVGLGLGTPSTVISAFAGTVQYTLLTYC